jgi:hypothetical protein
MAGGELDVLLAGAELPSEVHGALARVVELRRTLATREQAVATLESERKTRVADQERLRQNLAAAPEGSELHGRYLAALAAAEDRINTIDQQLEAARASARVAREELADFIGSLSL